MRQNPWTNLPNEEPYILPDDKKFVLPFNERQDEAHDHFIRFDIIPEAFVGSSDAPVVLLSNNPGYASVDQAAVRSTACFKSKMRKNLLHEPLDYPFVFLDPEFKGTYGQKWWLGKLRDLISEFGVEVMVKSVINVTYFPYASRRFGHAQVEVPSKHYSFRLFVKQSNVMR